MNVGQGVALENQEPINQDRLVAARDLATVPRANPLSSARVAWWLLTTAAKKQQWEEP